MNEITSNLLLIDVMIIGCLIFTKLGYYWVCFILAIINSNAVYDDERSLREYENIDEMIFENLLEHKLNFIKVANAYVQTLEIEKENNKKQLAIVDIPLIETLTNSKHNKKYRNDYIARYLKKYKRCEGMPFVKELNKIVEEHKLNLDGDYYNNLYLESKGE